MIHSLKILSLHDAHAKCSCERWEYIYTGKKSKSELIRRHKMHLSFLDGKGGKLR